MEPPFCLEKGVWRIRYVSCTEKFFLSTWIHMDVKFIVPSSYELWKTEVTS